MEYKKKNITPSRIYFLAHRFFPGPDGQYSRAWDDMGQENIVLLTALRLPELCRRVCAYAGLPVQCGQMTERFVLRSHQEDPELLAKLLEEAFVEDEAEVPVFRRTDPVEYRHLTAGQIIVQEGLESLCRVADELRRAAQRNQSDKPLVFVIERRDEGGKQRGVTWVALSCETDNLASSLQAAVVRIDS